MDIECPTRKVGYRSWWHAHRARQHVKRRAHHRAPRVYRCCCGQWHLGRDMRLS